jgi:predicted SAM-dependent methyltransferase
LSGYLEEHDINVTTMDIDENLEPDIVSSVTDIPASKNKYETTSCFEVLEHLPYPEALEGLREMNRVSRENVIISVPDRDHLFYINTRLPYVGSKSWSISFPRLIKLSKPKVSDEHFWEIGVKDVTAEKIISDIRTIGFSIESDFRVKEKASHHFFVLRCKQDTH